MVATADGHTPVPATPAHIIRFASWERVSTEDRQDPESSRAWQYARSKSLIEPFGGVIVVEFFDIDKSRSIPPQRRPEASKLLAALADPNRGFEAVVMGEPQRAFYGNQFGNTFPLFEHYGVPLWVPEVGRGHRSSQRGPRHDHVDVRQLVQRRAEPDQGPRPRRHVRPSPDGRPLPRRPAAIRVPADRCRAAPAPG